jgi:hypothetical protein
MRFRAKAWLECGTVDFLVQMWNSSFASICASNGQYVNSTYKGHVSPSNEMKFIVTLGSHQNEMGKREYGKTNKN